MLWRQGDVLIQAVEEIPERTVAQRRPILASGDSSHQRHQIKDGKSARLYTTGIFGSREAYLEVLTDEADLVHPEHETIVLRRGCYRVWRQREYTDRGFQTVID